MDKEKTAEQFLKTINLYSDFIEYGIKKNHKLPDLSHFNKSVEIKEKIIEKNNSNITPKVSSDKKNKIINLAESILYCKQCSLYKNAKKVPGIGNLDAQIFVIGYPPTSIEESAGKPMVGEVKAFFEKWLNAINININDIFITSLLKCPIKKIKISKEHIEKCLDYIDKQLEIIKPGIILVLGQLPLSSLKKSFTDIKSNHGQLFYYNEIPCFPIYHPLDVLKNPALKKIVWDDLKKFKKILEKNGKK